MNCLAVRQGLSEYALGALPGREATGVDRHLQWCAACRKEAGELHRAAAALAFSAAPAEPAPELEARVVEAVRRAADARGGRPAGSPHAHHARRGRTAVSAVIAAMIAVSALGWGAVMAGRAARFEDRVQAETLRTQSAIDRFDGILKELEFSADDQMFIGTIGPGVGGVGGGSMMTLVSPSFIDMAVVIVNGLPPSMKKGLPLTVRLASPREHLKVGRIDKLDSGGGDTISQEFDRDLTGFDRVIVRDANGRVVLRGTIATRAAVSSPAP